ncbi:hypothetical protein [Pararhodobacter zhoushanensis]|uniref:Uncharacterized protein n=1 Tax=Pararhodobacter zhoushanensis TaxID=2479545 RepID=A0ABT3H0Y8_9RHOB|nr:hypothetical protein [Pararhodobacter zhoushanensis]MCW1933454.1 hypothetical protein [Pararhodobacter zhoushanensis]
MAVSWLDLRAPDHARAARSSATRRKNALSFERSMGYGGAAAHPPLEGRGE